MARPQKQTVEYFPHVCDTEDSKTISVLQNKFGNDGYTFWFRLLEFLGRRNGLYFDYSNPADLEFLCAKTHQKDTETVLKMLAELDILNDIDHELYLQKVIWCQNFANGVKDAFSRSVSGPPKRPHLNIITKEKKELMRGLGGNLYTETPDNHTETPENGTETLQKEKEKEIKVKEKEKTTTPIPPPPGDVVEKNVYRFWTDEGFGRLTVFESEQLRDACEYYTDAWVYDALTEAVKHKAKNWAYVAKILENWMENGRDVTREELKKITDRDRYDKGELGHIVKKDFSGLDPARRKRLENTPGLK
jgi:DnaD/phage-associated family protein